MKHERNLLCFLLVGVMALAGISTVYATTMSYKFKSTDKKTTAVIDYSATWKTLSKDVGTTEMTITTHTGTDSRYSMASTFAYKNGTNVMAVNGYGYGSATATATVNATEFRCKGTITQYANGGTGLGNSGWHYIYE